MDKFPPILRLRSAVRVLIKVWFCAIIDCPLIGGVHQGRRPVQRFVLVEHKEYGVPTLTIDDFCDKYHLRMEIRQILKEEGFETAGALLETSADALSPRLGIGDIAELKRALRTFLTGDGRRMGGVMDILALRYLPSLDVRYVPFMTSLNNVLGFVRHALLTNRFGINSGTGPRIPDVQN
ncbi:hypothetical protein B0H17DRAFT_1182052 [Mycena rosella]|uniref:Uncharacterized protein n=1 Tax=Mycena rosella TaxID=1033263 RepID=A0AAD7D6W2_MYCRO|nr:hypothetical protein B0H17DRAFT_1182052 [Mycena rosella]